MYIFRRNVLQISSGIGVPGEVRWELALTLLLAWVLCYFCIFKGVKWTGKVKKIRNDLDRETETNIHLILGGLLHGSLSLRDAIHSTHSSGNFTRCIWGSSLLSSAGLQQIRWLQGKTYQAEVCSFYDFYLLFMFSLLQVWIDAVTQVFFSYGLGLGALVALGSYNPYHNNVYK